MASRANIYPCERETFPGSLFGKPTRRTYRAAIKEIVLSVKAQHNLSSEELGEKIGVSKDTIENAENEICSMEAVSLLALAFFYGEDAIAPVRNLYLCAPSEPLSKNDHIRKAREHLNKAEAME
jgi:DNA-binding XRE family transcriptional regulator